MRQSFSVTTCGFSREVNTRRSPSEIPASTPLAETISHDLKQRGFRFVGPTIVYSHMQATGMVNDHLVDCFRHRQVAEMADG